MTEQPRGSPGSQAPATLLGILKHEKKKLQPRLREEQQTRDQLSCGLGSGRWGRQAGLGRARHPGTGSDSVPCLLCNRKAGVLVNSSCPCSLSELPNRMSSSKGLGGVKVPPPTLDQAKGLSSSWRSLVHLGGPVAGRGSGALPGVLPGVRLCRSHFLAGDRLPIASPPALFKQDKANPGRTSEHRPYL